jgi:hypothetical protein
MLHIPLSLLTGLDRWAQKEQGIFSSQKRGHGFERRTVRARLVDADEKVAEKFSVSGSYMARVCSLLRVPRPEGGIGPNWTLEKRRRAPNCQKLYRGKNCSGRKRAIHRYLESVLSQPHLHRSNDEPAA